MEQKRIIAQIREDLDELLHGASAGCLPNLHELASRLADAVERDRIARALWSVDAAAVAALAVIPSL